MRFPEAPTTLDEILWTGGYPRIYERALPPHEWLAFRLPPFHANLGKRLVKTPKLYFYDVGLAANLLGLDEPGHLTGHPLRGALFETWVVGEIVKAHVHRGKRPRMSFYRDRDRTEVDLVLEQGDGLVAVEIKAAQTPSGRYFAGLDRFAETLEAANGPRVKRKVVVYGGETQRRSVGTLLGWRDLVSFEWW